MPILPFFVALLLAVVSAGPARALDRTPPEPTPPGGPVIPAATDADGERLAKAREHFVRGLALARQGDWNAALDRFLESRKLHPTRASLANVAVSRYNLRRYVEALEAYEELNHSADDRVPAQEKQKIRAIVAQLRSLVGEVLVTSNVSEPNIRIDGRDQGSLPAKTPLRVDPGPHRLSVSKPGYLSIEREFTVASGQSKEIDVTLLRLSEVSRLIVREARGRRMEVLLDGVRIGETPFSGLVGRGQHVLALRGPGRLGTLPVQTRVERGQQATVTLSALELDADVTIRPNPAHARIDFDRVPLGAGSWSGRLPSGRHTLGASADGYWRWRQTILIRPGAQTLFPKLERAQRTSFWDSEFFRATYLELSAGLAWSPSFGGTTTPSCAQAGCSDQSRPFGGLYVLRPGYRVTSRIGLELLAGYLHLSGDLQRRLRVTNTDPTPVEFQADLRDETRVSAPFAGLGVQLRLLERIPLLVRLSTGIARASVRSLVAGSFRGQIPHPEVPDLVFDYERRGGTEDDPQSLWIPLVGPEIRLGYPITDRLTLDLGLSGWLLLAPSYPRTGGLFDDPETRSFVLPDIPGDAGYDLGEREGSRAVRSGTLRMPHQTALGTLFLVSPSIAARYRF